VQAGLTNAMFMPTAATPPPTMGEVLPRAFATNAKGFGLIKFGFLPSLGVQHVRVMAPEAEASCAARRVAERLRDCDVRLEWSAVERALRRRSGSVDAR
jgi:hypothetical protein